MIRYVAKVSILYLLTIFDVKLNKFPSNMHINFSYFIPARYTRIHFIYNLVYDYRQRLVFHFDNINVE